MCIFLRINSFTHLTSRLFFVLRFWIFSNYVQRKVYPSKCVNFIATNFNAGAFPNFNEWLTAILLGKLTGRKFHSWRDFNNFAWINLRRWLLLKNVTRINLSEFSKKRETVKLSTRENSTALNYHFYC